MMDQRREVRYQVQEPCTLRVTGERGAVYVITILDVSKAGLRLSGSIALAPGAHVEVLCRGVKISGYVRYSRNTGREEFHMGIRAEDDSPGPRTEEGELDLTLLFKRK
jgi:hypothetical protein